MTYISNTQEEAQKIPAFFSNRTTPGRKYAILRVKEMQSVRMTKGRETGSLT